jgi:hypothetical protein
MLQLISGKLVTKIVSDLSGVGVEIFGSIVNRICWTSEIDCLCLDFVSHWISQSFVILSVNWLLIGILKGFIFVQQL